MTGFPGFLGSALLPKLLLRRPDVRAACIVQVHHLQTAADRLDAIEAVHPDVAGRTDLLAGDITEPDLGLAAEVLDGMGPVTEVWHLAAVYDLTVAEAVARRVNVDGTAEVLRFCAAQPTPPRLQYVSTCYVSGRYDGVFTEDMLAEGQRFNNHYESTKHAAEVLVRAALDEGLPGTIYRPGIVVGDSRTGETQKFDGPYLVARLLQRQPLPVAMLPAVDPTKRTALVPRDFVVDAMDELSVLDRAVGRTYALNDPAPPTNREVAELFASHLGKRLVWVPVPLGLTRAALARIPGLAWVTGLPAEFLDYFDNPTAYTTDHTVEDLRGTGLVCRPFESYVGRLLDFMREHPEIDAAAMV
ncbi:MAG: SDR family oxidoreductase [Nitriliruptoraceae bacterium]